MGQLKLLSLDSSMFSGSEIQVPRAIREIVKVVQQDVYEYCKMEWGALHQAFCQVLVLMTLFPYSLETWIMPEGCEGQPREKLK